MPKTNHNRNFQDKRDYSVPSGDWCRGKHGAAKDKRGAKKFKRSRLRFQQNLELKTQVKTYIDEVDISSSKFALGLTQEHSKLRKRSQPDAIAMECTQCKKSCNVLMVQSIEVRLCKSCYSQK